MAGTSPSATVRGWIKTLTGLERGLCDAERVDLLRALEELKGAAAATQARTTADFDLSQREQQAALGEPAARQGRGVAEQVALARRDSPARGGRHLGLAKALVREMPHTLAALTHGRISEWRATLLVRETAYLPREHRAAVDAELAAPDRLPRLEGMGDRELVAAAQRVAYRLDPHAVADRARRAASQRTVTLRPAPDTMSYLTALLPVGQGVACLGVLTRAAEAARAGGDERSKGQVMADALVEALAGLGAGLSAATRPRTWAEADREQPAGPVSHGPAGGTEPTAGVTDRVVGKVALQLVMTERTLLAGDDEPAHLVGYGTVPAGWARDLVRDTKAQVWLRRLYTHPTTGDLLAADARARLFEGPLREVLVGRDQVCRTPWCDAPIRHADHPWRRADGGTTSRVNGQGLCERCNYAKEAPGWRSRGSSPPGDRHTVTLTTPTGHVYRSRAPALPGTPAARGPSSRAEYHFADLLVLSA